MTSSLGFRALCLDTGALGEGGRWRPLRSLAPDFAQIAAHGLYRPNELGDDAGRCENLGAGECSQHGARIPISLSHATAITDSGRKMRSFWLTICFTAWTAAFSAGAGPVTVSGSAYVIDGDTLVIHGRHIRLFGVDAFEHDQMCGRLACGAQASSVMHGLTQAIVVTCEQQDIDPYGRMVAICQTSAGMDLGREMVRRGLAVAYRHFSLRYLGDEEYARTHRLGAWGLRFRQPANLAPPAPARLITSASVWLRSRYVRAPPERFRPVGAVLRGWRSDHRRWPAD